MLEVELRELPLEIWMPASVVSEEDHPIVTALRCAAIARAAATFRVERIVVYLDEMSNWLIRCQRLLKTHLQYLALPQYLRRKVFPRDVSLKYVGVMPPLRAPSHTVPRDIAECRPRDLRMGLTAKQSGSLVVEAGLAKPLKLVGREARLGQILLVRILDPNEMTCEIADPNGVRLYLNYDIGAPKKMIGELLAKQPSGCLKIGTSRLGAPVPEIRAELSSRAKTSKRALLAFGSPREGLHQMLQREGRDCNRVFDFVVNTAPEQGVATIRTEEAIAISLGALNDQLP